MNLGLSLFNPKPATLDLSMEGYNKIMENVGAVNVVIDTLLDRVDMMCKIQKIYNRSSSSNARAAIKKIAAECFSIDGSMEGIGDIFKKIKDGIMWLVKKILAGAEWLVTKITNFIRWLNDKVNGVKRGSIEENDARVKELEKKLKERDAKLAAEISRNRDNNAALLKTIKGLEDELKKAKFEKDEERARTVVAALKYAQVVEELSAARSEQYKRRSEEFTKVTLEIYDLGKIREIEKLVYEVFDTVADVDPDIDENDAKDLLKDTKDKLTTFHSKINNIFASKSTRTYSVKEINTLCEELNKIVKHCAEYAKHISKICNFNQTSLDNSRGSSSVKEIMNSNKRVLECILEVEKDIQKSIADIIKQVSEQTKGTEKTTES